MSDQTTGRWLNAAESGQVAEALAAVRSALMCHEPLTERLDIAIFAALALLRPAADDRQERAWLIHFEDADRDVEVFVGAGAEAAARTRSEQVGVSWNHTLFVAIAGHYQTDVDRRRLAALEACAEALARVAKVTALPYSAEPMLLVDQARAETVSPLARLAATEDTL